MMIYTVRINGKPIKNFTNKTDANNFLVWVTQQQKLEELREGLIESALAVSDMNEAKQVIKHIMDKK